MHPLPGKLILVVHWYPLHLLSVTDLPAIYAHWLHWTAPRNVCQQDSPSIAHSTIAYLRGYHDIHRMKQLLYKIQGETTDRLMNFVRRLMYHTIPLLYH